MAAKERLNRKQKRERRRMIPWTIFAALVYASFYIPVLVMILFSFNDAKRNYAWMGFTTEWYPKLFSFGNHDLWESLVYSLVIAILATVISVIIGVLGGIGLKKFEFRGKRFINMMLFVPIVVPEVVMAVSMLIIFIHPSIWMFSTWKSVSSLILSQSVSKLLLNSSTDFLKTID